MRRAFVAMLVTVLALPAVAHACPVCFDANEANRTAFVVTTIFMTTLPLSMFGAIVVWLRGRARDHDRDDHFDH